MTVRQNTDHLKILSINAIKAFMFQLVCGTRVDCTMCSKDGEFVAFTGRCGRAILADFDGDSSKIATKPLVRATFGYLRVYTPGEENETYTVARSITKTLPQQTDVDLKRKCQRTPASTNVYRMATNRSMPG